MSGLNRFKSVTCDVTGRSFELRHSAEVHVPFFYLFSFLDAKTVSFLAFDYKNVKSQVQSESEVDKV